MQLYQGRFFTWFQETHEKLNAEGVQDDRILEVYGDVVEEKTLRELVDKTVERYGGIDIVVGTQQISKNLMRSVCVLCLDGISVNVHFRSTMRQAVRVKQDWILRTLKAWTTSSTKT